MFVIVLLAQTDHELCDLTMLYCLTVRKTVIFVAIFVETQIWHWTILFSMFVETGPYCSACLLTLDHTVQPVCWHWTVLFSLFVDTGLYCSASLLTLDRTVQPVCWHWTVLFSLFVDTGPYCSACLLTLDHTVQPVDTGPYCSACLLTLDRNVQSVWAAELVLNIQLQMCWNLFGLCCARTRVMCLCCACARVMCHCCVRALVMWNSHCPQKLLLCSLTLSLVRAVFNSVIYKNTQGVPGGICHMSREHSITKHTYMQSWIVMG
jgi:hypothetical protein